MGRKGTVMGRLWDGQSADNELKWGQCPRIPRQVFYREKTKVGNQNKNYQLL
jgi:hypothetical protein